jgi:hypothetical protein
MDTTNIDDLPSDQVTMGGGPAQGNISLQMNDPGNSGNVRQIPSMDPQSQAGYTPNTVSESATTYDPNNAVPAPPQRTGEGNTAIHEQKIMNELVTGLQQASAGGATSLPSRDIPTTTTQFQDEQTKANFVPSPSLVDENVKDYIDDSDQGIINNRLLSKSTNKDTFETMYDEFQTPIILILLYFLYQLPVVRMKILYLLPSLHNDLGNPNISGYILNSILFGILYYIIMKSIHSLQQL